MQCPQTVFIGWRSVDIRKDGQILTVARVCDKVRLRAFQAHKLALVSWLLRKKVGLHFLLHQLKVHHELIEFFVRLEFVQFESLDCSEECDVKEVC